MKTLKRTLQVAAVAVPLLSLGAVLVPSEAKAVEVVVGAPPPAYVASYRPVYYNGYPHYWYGGRWYYRNGGAWRSYDREPPYLARYRPGWGGYHWRW